MLDSLQRRSRGRGLVALKRRLTGQAVLYDRLAEASQRAEALERRLDVLTPFEDVPLARTVRPPEHAPMAITGSFAEQLGDWQPDLERVDDELLGLWQLADEDDRTVLRVRLAVWQDAPGFCDRTGLRRADPPAGIHAMARGPLSAGGAFNAAELVADGVEAVGVRPGEVSQGLDFGGSSGRVIRVLAAAFPRVEWHSCDPNAEAIGWASEHLPGIDFHVSPQDPPLSFPDAHFELVYSISVWSHFSAPAALRWFDEMHRLVVSGGLLVITVQGWHTPFHLATHGLWGLHDVREAIADTYLHGHHFRQIFGPGGDFGVESQDWGFAMLSAEWLAQHLTPAWELLLWRPGAHEGNQDLVVLRRR